MRKGPLALLAALAAVLLFPKTLGVPRAPHTLPPSDLRDSLSGGFADLATLHEKVDLPGYGCAWCHLDMNPRAASNSPSRWIASAGPAAARTAPVTTSVCLSCHDGTLAKVAKGYTMGTRDPSLPEGSATHPVGFDYMASYLRAPDEFKHPAGNPEIRLEDGKVGCLSCHQGHERNGRPGGPAGVTQNTCLACHNR